MKKHLRRHAEMEALFGSDFLPVRKGKARKEKAAKAAPPEEPPEFVRLRKEVLACTKCGLHRERTQAVFGVGTLKTPLLFVGEGPGEEEDRQGEPFVGRAGKLLTRELKRLGVERREVYIANIVKCRPPGNRAPQLQEMQACMPYLFRQIKCMSPRILCALGNVAAQTLLNTKSGITQIRGRIFEAHGVRILPAFHPAYILRNMRELGLFQNDLARACREADLPKRKKPSCPF